MDILKYTSKVKTFKVSEVNMLIQGLDVGANDLLGKTELLKANSIDLSDVAESWFLTKSIQKQVSSTGFRSGLVAGIEFNARCITMMTSSLTKLVKDYNEKIWDGSTITIKQANIFNLVDLLTYWVKYSDSLLEVLLTMNNGDAAPEDQLTKFDYKHLNETMSLYTDLSVELMKGSKHILKDLESLPDAPVDEDTVEIINETGDAKTDLFNKGFGVHLITPVFWVELAISKIQIKRIEQMRRKNEQFAMKISQAINQKQGSDDPQLDRRIEIYQDAIIKHEAQIAKIEESYA